MSQNFLDFLVNSMPLTNDSYNYLVEVDGEYVNLGISPLYRDFVKKPFAMEIEVGRHIFIGNTDKTVFLIEDTPELEDYAVGEPLSIESPFDKEKRVLVYPKFIKDIEEYMDLKIDDGKLYYMSDEGQWVHDTLE